MDRNTESGENRGRPSKVVSLINEYELEGIGAEIEAEWTKEGPDRQSLRDLADYFNRELLRQALLSAGVKTIDGEIENFYRLLTADSTSDAERTRVQRRLEHEGINIDQLQSDFVSYQAIRTYLQNHRNANYETDDSRRVEQLQTTVEQFRNKLVAITESRLQRINGVDINIENPSTIASVQLVCTDCGQYFDINELSKEISCECSK